MGAFHPIAKSRDTFPLYELFHSLCQAQLSLGMIRQPAVFSRPSAKHLGASPFLCVRASALRLPLDLVAAFESTHTPTFPCSAERHCSSVGKDRQDAGSPQEASEQSHGYERVETHAPLGEARRASLPPFRRAGRRGRPDTSRDGVAHARAPWCRTTSWLRLRERIETRDASLFSKEQARNFRRGRGAAALLYVQPMRHEAC